MGQTVNNVATNVFPPATAGPGGEYSEDGRQARHEGCSGTIAVLDIWSSDSLSWCTHQWVCYRFQFGVLLLQQKNFVHMPSPQPKAQGAKTRSVHWLNVTAHSGQIGG